MPDPRADRELISALWIGAEERPGRLLDPDLADMVYSTLEYLTRATGVLFAKLDRVVEMTAEAVARRNTKRVTPLGRVTRSKVQAVVRVLMASGWLAHERKTCRARVLVCALQPTAAQVLGAELAAGLTADPARADDPRRAGTTEHCHHTTGSSTELRVNQPETCSGPERSQPVVPQEQNPPTDEAADRVAKATAVELVTVWRDHLRCRRAPNPAGAWYRCLLTQLRYDPTAAWALNEAVAALVARYGHAALSWELLARHLPEHGDRTVRTTPEQALAKFRKIPARRC